MKKSVLFVLPLLLTNLVFASTPKSKPAADVTTYFECKVKEPLEKSKKTIDVTVKFAVKNLDVFDGKGELLQYPGSSEDSGMVHVSPAEIGKGKNAIVPMMTNLNGQGGDLRVGNGQVRLWGDGDGYQFTDLVIFDADEDRESYDGYVRDYGDTYGDTETFKQFIKCKKSVGKVL